LPGAFLAGAFLAFLAFLAGARFFATFLERAAARLVLFLRVLLALFAARFLAPFFVPFFLPLAIVLPPGKIRTARIRCDSSRCRGPVRCGPCLWHSKVQHVRRTCSLSYAEHFGSACLSARM